MDNPTDKKLLLMPIPPNAEQQTAVAEAEPETTAISFTGPLTRDSLTEYTETQTIRNAKKVIPRIFRALAKGIDQGDRKCLEIGAQAYGLIGKGGGVTIINNLLQQNAYGGGQAERKQEVYFEGLIRGMDQEDQKKVIDVESES
jgi:hypothetical protein